MSIGNIAAFHGYRQYCRFAWALAILQIFMGNIYSNKLRAHWQYCKSVLKSKTTCVSCVNCVEFGHWHGFNWIPKTVQHRLRERCKWAAAARFVPQANFLETNARFWARSWLYPCSTKTREVLGNRSAREISWDLSEARGKSRGLREISLPPEFWWSTAIFSSSIFQQGVDQEILPWGRPRKDWQC